MERGRIEKEERKTERKIEKKERQRERERERERELEEVEDFSWRMFSRIHPNRLRLALAGRDEEQRPKLLTMEGRNSGEIRLQFKWNLFPKTQTYSAQHRIILRQTRSFDFVSLPLSSSRLRQVIGKKWPI